MTGLDRTLAWTAVMELWPGLTAAETSAVADDLEADMTAANPRDRWTYARRWIEYRREIDAGAAETFCSVCGPLEQPGVHDQPDCPRRQA